MTRVAEMTMALRAAHFQLQYLEGFLRLKAGRAKVLRGRGRGGGEYTVLDVRGYPGDVVQKSGEVPPGLKRKCLWMERRQRASGTADSPGPRATWRTEAAEACRGPWRESPRRRREGQKGGESCTRPHNRAHEHTLPRNTDGTALRMGKPPPGQSRRHCQPHRRLGVEIPFLGRDGAEMLFLGYYMSCSLKLLVVTWKVSKIMFCALEIMEPKFFFSLPYSTSVPWWRHEIPFYLKGV